MGILVDLVNRHYTKKESQPGAYWCEVYKVSGTNPATKRKKSVEVVEASNSPVEVIQEKSGLLPPYEVKKATRQATAAQLDALRKYGIKPQPGLSMLDASVFITRSIEGEPIKQPIASKNFVDYAIKNNVYIPKYANVKEAQDYLIAALPNKEKEINSIS